MVQWRSRIIATSILLTIGLRWENNLAYGVEIAIANPFTTTEVNFTKLKNVPSSQGGVSLSCPDDLKQLTALLLKDLPAYSNRVIQRTQDLNQAAGIKNYIITASKAEFEPLKLPRLQYDSIDDKDPEQVFFTVFERQYIDNKIVEIQTYHWLFLSKTDSGWRIVMMFSRFGNSSEERPPTPPKETTDGIIGRGVQLWLRDCRAGTLRL